MGVRVLGLLQMSKVQKFLSRSLLTGVKQEFVVSIARSVEVVPSSLLV